ncbi:MAG: adenosylcobinamide-phosphate synthase CbiB [Planctomycetota bacterium]|jgi:adenosylcobinamide-phosphate synthase
MKIWTLFDIFLIQTLFGLVVDHVIGDPQWFPHPARAIGRLISFLEEKVRSFFKNNLTVAGGILCFSVTIISAAAAFLIFLLFISLDYKILNFKLNTETEIVPYFSIISGSLLCGIWFSFKSLAFEADKIFILLNDNKLEEARKALAMIVGRDTDTLTADEITRATIETVAENSVDGGISPFFWSALGGPILLTFFKAASTLDSMVGYKNEKYIELGKISARLDDVLNYIPARLCFYVIPAASLLSNLKAYNSIKIGFRDKSKHPSPNAGIPESMFAGVLGVQLGGPSCYNGVVSEKKMLGDNDNCISVDDISKSINLLTAMKAVAALTLIILSTFFF